MRWLRRAGLGTEEIACRTAQNLHSLHRFRRPGKLMQTFAVAFKQSAIGLFFLFVRFARGGYRTGKNLPSNSAKGQ
jgi:hypothetical protein